jgi:hypothetical protein
LLAQLHAPDLAYHFHGDHLLALLLKYSAEQLNTLVNFESALLGLDGQFSVGVNTNEADQQGRSGPRCRSGRRANARPAAAYNYLKHAIFLA